MDRDEELYAWRIDTTADGFKFDYIVEKMKYNQELLKQLLRVRKVCKEFANDYVYYFYHPKSLTWKERTFKVNWEDRPLTIRNPFKLNWGRNDIKTFRDCYNVRSYKTNSKSMHWTFIGSWINIHEVCMEAFQKQPHIANVVDFVHTKDYVLGEGGSLKDTMREIKNRCERAQDYFVDRIYITNDEFILIDMLGNCSFEVDEVKIAISQIENQRLKLNGVYYGD